MNAFNVDISSPSIQDLSFPRQLIIQAAVMQDPICFWSHCLSRGGMSTTIIASCRILRRHLNIKRKRWLVFCIRLAEIQIRAWNFRGNIPGVLHSIKPFHCCHIFCCCIWGVCTNIFCQIEITRENWVLFPLLLCSLKMRANSRVYYDKKVVFVIIM